MPFVVKEFEVKEKTKAFLFLMKEMDYTQKEAQRIIARGRLQVNGEVMKHTAGYFEGKISFICFEGISRGLKPVFETPEFAIYDKPSGVLVHPQNRNTAYSMIDEAHAAYGRDANIAHRIDQETSGLLLISKNKEAERKLKWLFESRDIQKSYLALVHGEFPVSLEVDAPLLRREDEEALVRMVVKVHPEGKSAQTSFKRLCYYPELDMSLIECFPRTGRQHQIRVHLFHVKHPIVGDPLYGQTDIDKARFLDKEISPEERIHKSGAKRLMLHAQSLCFTHESQFCIVSNAKFTEEALAEANKLV
ncbi:RluA family pseudouridine synthase [Sulfurimonas sp. MAG313]|nr:RluA family pseudouridine synthase [Sulfurimonas sp. MAG313]MDF1880972.1 RluA family pseudouridine synthase [Sulfurimonas sp. MAG313]